MRVMGSPWKHVTEKFYAHFRLKPKRDLLELPDDYWVSERVLAQLQVVADAQGLWWHNSIRAADGFKTTKTYEELL